MNDAVTSVSKARSNAAELARWLLVVAALIVAIVAVGGITRLTESGVSITEWKPVSGALPPLSEAQWQAEFDAYRQTPQFTQVNGPAGMTLATYKTIFFWEWVHRLLARAIGLALVAVIAVFGWRRAIPPGYLPRLLALVALVGLQGAIGWWMVESGIVNDVRVSHFRLAAHLLTALLTLGGVVWTALDLRAFATGQERARLTGLGIAALAVLTVQVLLGALVAGLRAGHVASDWPLMAGSLVPDGIDWSSGQFHAFANDPFLLHFLHRWWAWAVVAVLVVLARAVKRLGARAPSIAIHAAFGTQIVLGIATVMSGIALWLAVLHQLVGALLVAATTWGAHAAGSQAGTTRRS
jgi:cytochrome c oxidase assembly protein subunit 15